jgi:hypothetical protein
MQPVVSAVRAVSDIRQRSENTSSILEKIRLYAEGAVDFAALLGLLVAQHWAISIEDHYYHLKRMPDDTLALDLTPFAKEAVVLKLPLWKTKLSHEERGGVGAFHRCNSPLLAIADNGARLDKLLAFLRQ